MPIRTRRKLRSRAVSMRRRFISTAICLNSGTECTLSRTSRTCQQGPFNIARQV